MIELEITKEKLYEFLNNIRKEDKEELLYSLGENYEDKFVNIVLKEKNTCFLGDKNRLPIAIGGIKKINFKSYKFGQVWLLSTKYFDKHRNYIFKYIRKKIKNYKEEYDVLFNYIYKSNFKALNWLKKFDFKACDKNSSFKLFYFKKGDNKIDLRYFTCK